ncbi:MAG: potassium transporter Kup [Parcubacteria group bacterium]
MVGGPEFATTSSAPSDRSQTLQPPSAHATRGGRFWPLALGSLGVVYGDIGTSPLYAFREALAQTAQQGVTAPAVLGVVSLALWALILVVTVKYVFFIMRLDNRGEGGVLSLMALAEGAAARRTAAIFFLGVAGAALFYGDAIITPALSVLSAVEGLRSVPSLSASVTETVVLVSSLAILIGLFAVQSKGTAKVARFFGPICLVWFAVLAALGFTHLVQAPGVLLALSPTYAVGFLATHGGTGLFVLGSVFLTVTGAEALYADLGHFGRRPISYAWLFVVLPCLAINYLGQGAEALVMLKAAGGKPIENADWFFIMAPEALRAPVVILATIATVIASQAVITGAYSLTNQAIQLGLLPRMVVRNTSASEAGQIFLPQVNMLLLIGVIFLVGVFKSSSALANAYGLSVTGTMVVTTSLAFVVTRGLWKWPLWKSLLVVAPLLVIDLVFLGANMLKLFSGGFVPVALGAALFIVMATWVRGQRILTERTASEATPLKDIIAMLTARGPFRVKGTAVFLVGDPEQAPTALLHNLKHNRVLHETNVVLTVRSADVPYIAEPDRVRAEKLDGGFWRVVATWGFMETPNVPRALAVCRKQGLKFDIMSTSFFLGRRTVVRARNSEMPRWQDKLYILLSKNAAAPTDFYRLPPGRVVEMGAQVSV